MTFERRFAAKKVELRETGHEDRPVEIHGYAAVFNTLSDVLGRRTTGKNTMELREKISPEAFDNVLDQDTRAFFNHDPNFVLGRRSNGTLELSVDDVGLRYVVTPPNTQMVRDMLLEPMKRGDIDQSSFGFILGSKGDKFEEDDNGNMIRSLVSVEELRDVSPVTMPAYPDATAALRSWGLEENNSEVDEHKRIIVLQNKLEDMTTQRDSLQRRLDVFNRFQS